MVIIAGMVIYTIFLVREIRRNEQHDSFINAVTHELKTPVASIRLYLETLQSRDLDDAKRREFYQIMLEDSDRLLHTIEQVLRAGATGSIRAAARGAASTSAQIARECVELARTRFHLGPDALETSSARRHAIVLGDGEELKAAVWNLIDNAVKYSAAAVKVRVELEELAAAARGRPRHRQGVGISPAELKRIFKRFYRIPASVAVRTKGTGLGLFIVRSVARSTADARSPKARARDAAARSRCCCRPRRRPREAPHAQRVLIVEDEQHLAEGLRFNLEAEGYRPTS